MHQSLKYYRVQAFIRTASFKVRTSPQIEDRSYVGNRLECACECAHTRGVLKFRLANTEASTPTPLNHDYFFSSCSKACGKVK